MFSLLIPIPLALFLALFIVSVFADRVLHADTLAKWSFGLSGIPLLLAMSLALIRLMCELFISTPPLEWLEWGDIDKYKWVASELGGRAVMSSFGFFCISMAAGVMYLLACFVGDVVEPMWYGFMALFGLVVGLVILLGFFVFFEGLALILGLVATIIGIVVGFRKLDSRNKG